MQTFLVILALTLLFNLTSCVEYDIRNVTVGEMKKYSETEMEKLDSALVGEDRKHLEVAMLWLMATDDSTWLRDDMMLGDLIENGKFVVDSLNSEPR